MSIQRKDAKTQRRKEIFYPASLRLCGFAFNEDPSARTENDLARIIVDAAIEVHRELGAPGLLEFARRSEFPSPLRHITAV